MQWEQNTLSNILSALIWYQNQIHILPTFWDITICVQDRVGFLWKCDFEKSAFKVSYSYSLGYDRFHEMQNVWITNLTYEFKI